MQKKSISLYARTLILILLSAAGLGCQQEENASRVVLITLDTLRYDSFSDVDGNPTEMPRLAAWAQDAAVFDRYYSAAPSTQPSHSSMFTGLQPWEHGVAHNGLVLDNAYQTVAEHLKNAGFTTSAVIASLPVGERFGYAQGFDRFLEDFETGKLNVSWRRAVDKAEDVREDGAEPDPETFFNLGDIITDRAVAEIDAATGPRQFFWFHYFDPHAPWGDTGDERALGPLYVERQIEEKRDVDGVLRRARRLYDQDVDALDRQMERILSRLDQDASEIPTHIILVADHGESFGEDGSLGHGRRLTTWQLHVPLLIRSPKVEPGRRQDVVGSIDIAATLLALAGVDVELPRSRPAIARDLTSPPSRPGRAFGMRRPFGNTGIRELRTDGERYPLRGNLFFMVDENGNLVRGNGRRSENVADEATAEELRNLFGDLEAQLARRSAEKVDDEDTRRGLEALGYTN